MWPCGTLPGRGGARGRGDERRGGGRTDPAAGAAVTAADPDVIENHNLHGFDLPFSSGARDPGVPLGLGRIPSLGVRQRGRGGPDTLRAARARVHRHARRGAPLRLRGARAARPRAEGRGAALRHLRARARADPRRPDPRDVPDRSRARPPLRHADVREVAALARCWAARRTRWRNWRRVATNASPTPARDRVIDPLLVRTYLRAGHALPVHESGDGTTHSGAALHLFATGVADGGEGDVASLYPSLMRTHRIGPGRDRLGAMLALVDGLVERRLAAKRRRRRRPRAPRSDSRTRRCRRR